AMDQKQFEKIRAVFDRSGVALTLVDMSLPEQPLVLANPPFLRMTGYTEGQILGFNCRFLQRGDENAQARADIRDALKLGRELQVVLRNYRANDEPFDNLLFLHPVGGRPDAPDYFLGSQFELGRSGNSEEAAAAGHAGALTGELARIGTVAARLEMDSRRHLAQAAAALVRAWERRG
uniref:LOV protein n=1 Tax=Cereibacter sphaeroides (strain ATCC 17025 / ATH 2.4.3) TaxID=349102 RepID=M1E1G2_CERS5|nr:Chain A, LOV protein [Cereibacter sphaeroides ATCC 17025]4HJ4_B Chain B, LOV protein [Cereibacter sphaeroides ATCC 17025]4HNB_A Chain A, LOV protein [Cereibacter sphaeroides ATCC 17025]4HNB_B Chain B, LOV protein [Cereibacter sphaeroides ATCC 17025]